MVLWMTGEEENESKKESTKPTRAPGDRFTGERWEE
jgi:hypothetical protein